MRSHRVTLPSTASLRRAPDIAQRPHHSSTNHIRTRFWTIAVLFSCLPVCLPVQCFRRRSSSSTKPVYRPAKGVSQWFVMSCQSSQHVRRLPNCPTPKEADPEYQGLTADPHRHAMPCVSHARCAAANSMAGTRKKVSQKQNRSFPQFCRLKMRVEPGRYYKVERKERKEP